MKKTARNAQMGMSIGMCLGVGVGSALGQTLFHSMPMGMCMGMCCGLAIGMALGSAKDKAINDQLEQLDYRVTAVAPTEAGGAQITVTDKNGASRTVTLSKTVAKAQAFAPGDRVYLHENGDLEQAFDKASK